ncbi:BMP family protein [Roseomonas sp. NAR14]|uniref:BMP family protein n=1 Tax=Roseomonas acroporae TaxID=2937791 RepID=A0A9X1Y5J5_9PROT|nr:BMP family protein [Roseomonas acroporae]MCK8783698.1 BMP family protein [Roseomonas acroporae]
MPASLPLPLPLPRRGLLALPFAAGLPAGTRAATPMRLAALFAGRVDDGGFMQAGHRGLERARDTLGAEIRTIQGIPPEAEALKAALRRLAADSPDLVIAHGGQNNAAAQAVAAEFPGTRFVVTQGNVTGPNLASYEVLQEQSAFLAGMLAGLSTRSGVVGHQSGIRVVPGLKGRAAYAHGVRHANPAARLLTNFSGSQDDPALARRIAEAMFAAGADIVFTMLNAGRSGVTEACRAAGRAQIGNVGDWVAVAPDVFLGSAVADSGQAVLDAVLDLAAGRFQAGAIRRIGLEQPEAVRLTLAPRVPAAVAARIAAAAEAIAVGRLDVPVSWSGEEFPTP